MEAEAYLLHIDFATARGALMGMSLPVTLVDRQERLLYLNQSYLDLFERPGVPSDFLGLTIGQFYYRDPDADTLSGRCMREDRAFRDLVVMATTETGRSLVVRYDVTPIHDSGGDVIGAFAVVVDLTAERNAQSEIARLAAFLHQTPQPVYSFGSDASLTYVNPAAETTAREMGLEGPALLLPTDHADIVSTCLATGTTRFDVESNPVDRVFSWAFHPVPASGLVHVYGSDITQRKWLESELAHRAFHDELTSLPNRTLLLHRLTRALERTCEGEEGCCAILSIDLDDFKTVNDSLGHAAGDVLLRAFGARLVKLLGPEVTVSRPGEDEFVVLLEYIRDPSEALRMAEEMRASLAAPFAIQGREVVARLSVGIAVGRLPLTAQDLMRDADTAVYRAKASGKGQIVFFDESMHRTAAERFQTEVDLKRAIETEELEVFYQPLVHLASGTIQGFEALVRWHHPQRGLVSPVAFIQVAEESGLILPLGRQVMERACRQAKEWNDAFPDGPGLLMSVNVSVRQLRDKGLVDEVGAILRSTGLDPSLLKVEITESGIMGDVEESLRILDGFRNIGVRLSIDDFGTGYSSLSYLHRFPFDYLKVDRSFVVSMAEGSDNLEIVKLVVSLAHTLGKEVIAEGIETSHELAILRGLNCEFGQGYFFARPMPAKEARRLLEQAPRW